LCDVTPNDIIAGSPAGIAVMPTPDQVADQLHSLHGLITALHASARPAGMTEYVINSLEFLRDDCAGIAREARAVARAQRVSHQGAA
jgi:hypothetical protein